MNLDLIRAVDKWVGIPACFMLSLAHRMANRLRAWRSTGAPRHTPPKRMLFLELSEMGSAILAYPAMKYVTRTYSEVDLYFLIFEQNRFSVDVLGVIPRDHVFTISVRSPFHFVVSTCKAVLAMRSARLDVVFDLELFSRFSALLSGLSGAQMRAGYATHHEEGLYRGGFLTHRVLYNPHQHMAKNFLVLVKSIEYEHQYSLVKEIIHDGDLELPVYHSSDTDLSRLKARLTAINPAVEKAEHLILLNPNAGSLLPIRAWPVENYAALTRKIIECLDCVIVVIGLEDAGRDAEKIIDHVGPQKCIDFTNKTSFKDLLDLLSLGDLLITADGGPAHFAALTSIKNIVLFGPETPVLYAPLGAHASCLFADCGCSPCLSAYNHRNTSCTDPRCMKAISVESVLGVVVACLTGEGI